MGWQMGKVTSHEACSGMKCWLSVSCNVWILSWKWETEGLHGCPGVERPGCLPSWLRGWPRAAARHPACLTRGDSTRLGRCHNSKLKAWFLLNAHGLPSLSQKIIKSSHRYIRDVCNQEHEMSSIWTLKWNQEGKMGLIITSLPQITLPIRNNG